MVIHGPHDWVNFINSNLFSKGGCIIGDNNSKTQIRAIEMQLTDYSDFSTLNKEKRKQKKVTDAKAAKERKTKTNSEETEEKEKKNNLPRLHT